MFCRLKPVPVEGTLSETQVRIILHSPGRNPGDMKKGAEAPF